MIILHKSILAFMYTSSFIMEKYTALKKIIGTNPISRDYFTIIEILFWFKSIVFVASNIQSLVIK